MAQKIQLKRGSSANLSSLTLEAGEPAIVLDTGKMWIGLENGDKVLVNPDAPTSVQSAAKLTTARTISISGDATGSTSFDGSANKSIAVTLASSGVSAGTHTKVTVDAKGRVTAGAALAASDIPALTISKISDAGTAAKLNTGTGSGNVPVLDSGGKLAESVLPALAITSVFEAASQSAMLALSGANIGDVCVRTDLNKSYILKQTPYSTLSNWIELRTPTDAVLSVNGSTGAVSVTTITGNAGTATKLAASRTVRTNLGSTSTASFDGSANITPGVTGTLALGNGGTGATTAAAARSALGCLGTADVIDGGTF